MAMDSVSLFIRQVATALCALASETQRAETKSASASAKDEVAI